MIVQLFIPCFVDQLYPDTAFNMIKVLEKLGCTVDYDVEQTCCGQPAFNAGFWEESKSVCEKFVRGCIKAKKSCIFVRFTNSDTAPQLFLD